MDAFSLLEQVHDRTSFIKFVEVLIEDRKKATKLEKGDPKTYQMGGANDWQNSTIEGYLESALACIEDNYPQRDLMNEPSWRSLANFLYAGKIYE